MRREEAGLRSEVLFEDLPLIADEVLRLTDLRGKATGPRVLMATGMGGYAHGRQIDSMLDLALTLRGARVDTLVCDKAIPVCQIVKMANTSTEALSARKPLGKCAKCFGSASSFYNLLGIPFLRYSEFVTDEERRAIERQVAALPLEELATLKPDGLPIGEHALAGALRFFARSNLDGEAGADVVLRRFTEAALLTALVVDRALERGGYDVVVAHHGIYVPQGLVVAVAHKRNVRVVTWNASYRKQTFVFSHDDTYHHTMISEPTSVWEAMPWTPAMEAETYRYLKSRWHGTEDWIWFHNEPQHDTQVIRDTLGLDPSKPVVTLLTSVVWDAQLHYESNAFPSMLDWVIGTIRHFTTRPDLQLVIRVHPAELTGFVPSRQRMVDEIAKVFPETPANLFVVGAESPLSTYTLAEMSDTVLIYSTKTGIEVTSMGLPTIVAGEAWIRNKGLSDDPTNPEEYYALLDRLPKRERLPEAVRQRALRYAFHFFFRRMIHLPFAVHREGLKLTMDIQGLDDLAQGRYPGLDTICDGILSGRPFHYPAERILAGANGAQEVN